MEAYKKMIWGSVVLAVLLIVPLVVYFFFLSRSTPAAPPVPKNETDTAPQAEKQTVKETEIQTDWDSNLPPLDIQLNDSDETIRTLMKHCSDHPEFSRIMANDDLIRRAVAITDNIAGGISPTPHLEFLQPGREFEALKKADRPGMNTGSAAGGNRESESEYIYISPGSYSRYNAFAAVVASLDTGMLLENYRRLEASGVLDQAFKELGNSDKQFENTLIRAINELLAVPLLEGEIQLEKKIASYAYADPQLEALSPAQKHLLRMGPQNIKKIQVKLKEIKNRLSGKKPAI